METKYVPQHFSATHVETVLVQRARQDPLWFIWYLTEHRPARHHEIWMKAMMDPDTLRLNIIGPRFSAKAQPLDAKILTPDGWTTMGQLRAGDCVIAGDGTATEVLGIFPQGKKQIYKVTFSDGSSTRCTAEHLWKVRLLGGERGWEVLPLEKIKTQRWRTKGGGRWGRPILREEYYAGEDSYLDGRNKSNARYHIPVVEPVRLSEKKYFIDPYVMGVFLGDGSIRGGSVDITSADSDIVSEVQARLQPGYSLIHKPGRSYGYQIQGNIPVSKVGRVNEYRRQLTTYGLTGLSETKFIPEEYFLGSVEQRLDILQGLLDTDGTLAKDKASTPVFTSTSKQLVEGVIRLTNSLGGTATVNTFQPHFTYKGIYKAGKLAYRVHVKLPAGHGFVPFKLVRKAANYVEPSRFKPTRGILKIEEDGFEEAQCIMVAHPDHTYVTDDHIVTHNSTITVYAMAWFMATYPYETNGIIAVSANAARDRLSMLRGLFSENARFRNVFPHIHIDKKRPDTQDEFSIWSDRSETGKKIDYRTWRSLVIQRGSDLNKNPGIFAAGNGGKGVIGRRITGILLLDDMVDETFLSVEAQNKIVRYIAQTLNPCMGEGAKIWNIGTRWMLDDIYEQLAKNPMWKTITIPAILYDEDNRAWSYWPQFWPLHRLERERLTMNDDMLFRIMFLCDPSAVTLSLFRREHLFKGLPEVLPEFEKVFITSDMAVSLKSRADFNVLYVVGVDKQQNVFILDGVRFKEEAPDAVELMIQLADAAFYLYGRCDGVLVEDVGFQVIFEQLLRGRRPDILGIPVSPKGDKGYRARPVSHWAYKGKLFINQGLFFIEQLRTEWFNFPVAKHDDTLDAVSILFQHLTFGNTVSAQLLRIKPQNTDAVLKAKVVRLRRS